MLFSLKYEDTKKKKKRPQLLDVSPVEWLSSMLYLAQEFSGIFL